jgi:hypothetical protein
MTSGGHSVGIVRSRTQARIFFYVFLHVGWFLPAVMRRGTTGVSPVQRNQWQDFVTLIKSVPYQAWT